DARAGDSGARRHPIMSETSTTRVHAWEAVTESDSTTDAGARTSSHTTTLKAGLGSGKSHFLLRAPSLLATFYKEPAQHEAARNVEFSSFLISPPLHSQATLTGCTPMALSLSSGSLISGGSVTTTSTTVALSRSCTLSGHLLATTASVIAPDPFRIAPVENNITKFDPLLARQVARHVAEAFASAMEETFEDGVHSKFEKTLGSLIRVAGNNSLK